MVETIEIITPDELMAYPGAGSPTEAHATIWVDMVNGLISEAWANPEEPVPVWVRTIALEAAGRASRNPKGLQSWTRSLDDGSRTERVSDRAARFGLYLDADELRRLRGERRTRRNRFGTIRVTPGI